jgi:hypothetical protein
MQFHQQLNQFARSDSRGWIADIVKLTYQVADPLYALLKVLFIFHDPPDNTRSESLNQVAKRFPPATGLPLMFCSHSLLVGETA